MKNCTSCKKQKSPTEFYKNHQSSDRLQSQCKQCSKRIATEWQRANLYGITPDEKAAILCKQDNKCSICKIPFHNTRHTHVDHNHKTGKVRGILCNHCNHLLGNAKDTIEVLENAITYLTAA